MQFCTYTYGREADIHLHIFVNLALCKTLPVLRKLKWRDYVVKKNKTFLYSQYPCLVDSNISDQSPFCKWGQDLGQWCRSKWPTYPGFFHGFSTRGSVDTLLIETRKLGWHICSLQWKILGHSAYLVVVVGVGEWVVSKRILLMNYRLCVLTIHICCC